MTNGQPAPTPTPTPTPAVDPKDVQENKAITILSYIGILCLVPLLAKKDSKFAQFHAKQGLVLLISWVVLSVIFVVPFLGWVVGFIGYIILLILMIMGIINVLSGKMTPLPVIGGLAGKFKI